MFSIEMDIMFCTITLYLTVVWFYASVYVGVAVYVTQCF